MKISLATYQNGAPYAYFEDEPELRAWLLQGLLMDCDGQEDFYLSEIARAQAGETIRNLYNNFVHLYIYPDLDVVVLEDFGEAPLWNNEDAEEPPACTFLTVAQTKQLILDWLEAKRGFYAERRRLAVN